MLTWLRNRLHRKDDGWKANRAERRALERLARIPRHDLAEIVGTLRRLPADCQTRVLDGLPAWQQEALQAALRRGRHSRTI
jgi:hypothetical protein